MTKKLLVVLVVLMAMLICVAVVTAKEKPSSNTDATMYTPPASKLGLNKATDPRIHNLSDIPMHANFAETVRMDGSTYPEMAINPGYGATPYAFNDESKSGDTCLVKTNSAPPSYVYAGWLADGQLYAQLADAEGFCALPTYPFGITNVYYHIYAKYAGPSVTGYFAIAKADMSNPTCPIPGQVIWTSATYTWGPFSAAGVWRLSVNIGAQVCVNGPYFVEFYLVGPVPPGDSLEVNSDQSADACQSYYNEGTGWYDMVTDIGFSGNCRLYSSGLAYKDGYNTCPAKPSCDYVDQHLNAKYVTTGFDGAAEQFTSPRTGYISRARIMFNASYLVGTPSARFTLWSGDATLGPVTSLGYIDVANADLKFYPEWTEVDFSSLNIPITFGDMIFAGYMTQRSDPGDDLPGLQDQGLGPAVTTSWFDDAGTWMSEYDEWGDYCHSLIELELCGQAPCDTVTADLSYYMEPTTSWAYPSTSGRLYPNGRFSVPYTYGARLDQIRLAFYSKTGTPSATVYLWMDDGTGVPLDANPPNNAVASWPIASGDVVTYPTWQTIDTWTDGIYFTPGEEFHVGYTIDMSNPTFRLGMLSDDYNDTSNHSDRISWWWPTLGIWQNSFDHYGVNMSFVMEVTLCEAAPPESTFVLSATPGIANIVPGDANKKLYDIATIAVAGYGLNVNLDIVPATLPAGVTYSYVPASIIPPTPAQLYMSADLSAALGEYTLTVRGTGTDGQVKTADVILKVQPPYNETLVHFFHGVQKVTNYGAVANGDSTDNFTWYGTNYLFDGSFFSATTDADHIAMDVYNCSFLGFAPPISHLVVSNHTSWCASTPYEEHYGEVAFSDFYTDTSVISCEWDSMYIVGLVDVPSTDFSIKIRIIYNPDGPAIPLLHTGLYEDWDIGNAYKNSADMDIQHNFIWQYDPLDPTLVFGILYSPFYDETMLNMNAVRNPVYVWPGSGFCGTVPSLKDSLYLLMTRPGFMVAELPDTDLSLMASPPPFQLDMHQERIQIWFNFGRNLADGFTWEQWYHKLLRYAGFYRGDVNGNDTLEVPALDVSDLVYLRNYLYQNGPAPQPFVDQGNVDGKGPYGSSIDMVCPKNNVDVQDLVYLLNYVFKNGPAPVDYVRFIPSYWSRPSLFTNPNW